MMIKIRHSQENSALFYSTLEGILCGRCGASAESLLS